VEEQSRTYCADCEVTRRQLCVDIDTVTDPRAATFINSVRVTAYFPAVSGDSTIAMGHRNDSHLEGIP